MISLSGVIAIMVFREFIVAHKLPALSNFIPSTPINLGSFLQMKTASTVPLSRSVSSILIAPSPVFATNTSPMLFIAIPLAPKGRFSFREIIAFANIFALPFEAISHTSPR